MYLAAVGLHFAVFIQRYWSLRILREPFKSSTPAFSHFSLSAVCTAQMLHLIVKSICSCRWKWLHQLVNGRRSCGTSPLPDLPQQGSAPPEVLPFSRRPGAGGGKCGRACCSTDTHSFSLSLETGLRVTLFTLSPYQHVTYICHLLTAYFMII